MHQRSLIAVVVVILTCWVAVKAASPYRRVCYFWESMPVDKINLTVCTHFIYYGVKFDDTTWTYFWPTSTDATNIETLKQLRKQYGFKLMAVFSSGMGKISSTQENMDKFANITVNFMRQSELDGLDTDWEFPRRQYREPYADIMTSLRKAFDAAGEPKLQLSMATSGFIINILESYDIPKLAEAVDFMDIMGYDYRAWGFGFHVTGHSSPLYATKYDPIFIDTLNLNWSATYFATHGMPKEKIVLGLPSSGTGWTLLSPLDHGLFALASGPADPPTFETPDVCKFVKANGTTRVWDTYAQAPYAYNGKNWYSFEDWQSVTAKANYIKKHGFGGSMVWSLVGDADFNHQCDTGMDFPIHSLLTELLG